VQNRKLFAQSRTKPCKSDYFNPTKTHAFPTLSAFFTGDKLWIMRGRIQAPLKTA